VAGLRVVREEVEGAPALLDVVLGVRPQAVHQVRKLHAVADEEHLNAHAETLFTAGKQCAII
jgi:hypothetical protein